MECSVEFDRGLVGMGWIKGGPEVDVVMGVPSAAVADSVGAERLVGMR